MAKPFNILSARTKNDNAERAAAIKAKVGVSDAIVALGLDSDLGDACPCCGGFGLKATDDNRGWACAICPEKGDVITLVRAARDIGFAAACDLLEDVMPGGKCARTGDLFS